MKNKYFIQSCMKVMGAFMFATMLSVGFTACTASDDNPANVDEASSGSVGSSEFTPTKILMTRVYVAPTVDAKVRQVFEWATEGVVSDGVPDEYSEGGRVPVYVVNKLTDIAEEKLEDIFDHGETVILVQPDESEIKNYQASHPWLAIDPELNDSTWILGFSNDSKAVIDYIGTTGDPVVDNANAEEKSYIMLAGYITKLNNMYKGYYLAAGGGDDDEETKKIENLFASYHFIHTNTYTAHVHYDTTWGEKYYLDGTGSATTLIDVYPIHVYEGQAGAGDYFAVKMNTSVANAGMWKGKGWDRRIGIYIRWCGFWATNFDTQVVPMLNASTPMPETKLQFLAACPPTPETTRNKTEYEDSKSFSLNVTATGKGEMAEEVDPSGDATSKSKKGLELQLSLGWEWSHRETYTIENVEIEDRHSGNSLDWNIKFNDLPHFKWLEDYGFKITESLPYRNTQGVNASWMWYDPSAKDESATEPLLIKVTTNPQYEMQHFWTTEADLDSKTYNHSKSEYFKIPRPNNKCAGEIVIKNDLGDKYIYDIQVIRKGNKNRVVGGFEMTVPNGQEQSLGWYYSTNCEYLVTFMANDKTDGPKKYVYTLNDGFKLQHKGKVTLYAANDFSPE